jgi:RNA polymerase sigma factor (sigma-70 family)
MHTVAKYRLTNIAELARQLDYAPPKTRLAQLGAAEGLIHSIDSTRGYPYDYIVFRITGYRPRAGSAELLTGAALLHDLGLLIERLSETLNMPTGALPEPVLTIEDVCQRFNVTSKTIQRWRRRGLPARRFIFPDGKRRVGFLVGSVERFFATHRDPACRGTNFSQIDETERDEILRRSRRLAVPCQCCQDEIARRIARRLNRSPVTVLHVIRKHDAEHPEAAIFPLAAAPVPPEERAGILTEHARGVPIHELARRHGQTRSAIYRVLVEERAAALTRRKIRFIDDPLYHQPDASDVIDQLVQQQELAVAGAPEDHRIPRDLPPYLQELYRTPLLTAARERALFLKFNFHKWQFVHARRRMEPQFARARDLVALETTLQRVIDTKNAIVRANLRLVVSVARKHLRPGLNLMELISDGNITLMRAVEGFDIHRGHRFSTYATLALMKGFARGVGQMLAARRSTRDAMLSDLADANGSACVERAAHRDEVRHALGRLSERERSVILAHFGLEESSPATYEEVGRRLGLSKQRVRQIEQGALAKMRDQLSPRDPDVSASS